MRIVSLRLDYLWTNPLNTVDREVQGIKQLMTELWPVRQYWLWVGIALEVDLGDIESSSVYPTCGDKLYAVLSTWLRVTCPMWSLVIKALRSEPVSCHRLAKKLEETYCTRGAYQWHTSQGNHSLYNISIYCMDTSPVLIDVPIILAAATQTEMMVATLPPTLRLHCKVNTLFL